MRSAIFSYLRRKNLSDIRMVNRLFVSAFMRYHGLIPSNNPLLVDAYISPDDESNALVCELMEQLEKSECKYDLEDLTKLFEFVISPKERKVSGSVYTPEYIRERIVRDTLEGYDNPLADIHAADIACGCGGFFLTLAEYLHSATNKSYAEIINENLYGIDIQDYSVERTKLLLSLLALVHGEDCNLNFNIYHGDSLCFDFSQIPSLDVIVGNPPYVCARNIDDDTREKLRNLEVCSSGNIDLYIPFFQVAIENIRMNGRVGYITMNSFLTSLNGKALREYFHRLSYSVDVVDFRGTQMFEGKNTYTCLFFLHKTQTNCVRYYLNDSVYLHPTFNYSLFDYDMLDAEDGWKLNNYYRTKQMESVGTPLGKYCQSRHGIATLSNKTYVFYPVEETDDTFVFLRGKSRIQVEKDVCRRIVNSNKLNSAQNISDITEYVIFPYRRMMNGSMELIPEFFFRQNYPLAYNYLLNCRGALLKRDKGNTSEYPAWYAYGRTQSLRMPRYKLFFPKIANCALHCEIVDDEDLLLYNGMAFVADDNEKVVVLKKILESDIFWSYVTGNSKPYSSEYYSLNGINIKNFGIPNFTNEEKQFMLSMRDQEQINDWLKQFYYPIS